MSNSIMAREAAEAPQRIAEQLAANAATVAQVVAQIGLRKPKFVYMVGRGSSDHAGVFAKYLIEIEIGLPVAAAAPSIASVYNKSLQLTDALVLVNPLPPLPWSDALPPCDEAGVVPWRQTARLAGTRRALPDSDDATALFAFRHWRDESGRVLREARGVRVERPACPMLCIASANDEDVPAELTGALAAAWGAECWPVAGGHVSPLLGRQAPALAARVVDWLSRA